MTITPTLPSPFSWRIYLFFCLVAIAGVRGWFIERYGANLALVDEWEATGQRILAPWHEGTLTWEALFRAHNGDHRIVASRLWEIFWFEVNGSWDPRLVMTAKAGLYALAAVVFIHLLAGSLPRWRHGAAALLAALFAFPFSHHNLVWAFQAQFDFFLLASALGWLALTRGRPWLACALAAGSLLTLGAGPMLATSFVPFYWLQAAGSLWSWRRAVGFTALSLGIAMTGFLLRTSAASEMGSPAQQARALSVLAAWPYSNVSTVIERLPEASHLVPAEVLRFPGGEGWLLSLAAAVDRWPILVLLFNAVAALALLAPLGILAWRVFARRTLRPEALGPLALGAFGSVALAATAVARADLVTVPARYLDLVVLTGFAALASGLVLAGTSGEWRRGMRAWGVLFGLGYATAAIATIAQLEARWAQLCEPAVRQYLATGDRTPFAAGSFFQLPILENDPTAFLELLDDPRTRAVLPRALVAPNEPPGFPAWLARVAGRFGLPIAVLAIAGMLGTVLAGRQPARRGGLPAWGWGVFRHGLK